MDWQMDKLHTLAPYKFEKLRLKYWKENNMENLSMTMAHFLNEAFEIQISGK